MRRLIPLLVVMLLLAAISPTPAHAATRTGAYASTVASLNLRSGPGTQYSVRRLLPCGARVYVGSGPFNTYWYKVSWAGSSGYVHGGFLAQQSAPAQRCAGGATSTAALNLRTGPGTSYPVVRLIPTGGRLTVVSGPLNGAWYRASYNGASGYVHGAYLAQGQAVTVNRLDTQRRVAALTFDAGADTGYTKLILDTLSRTGVKASFGMTGKWAAANPGLLQRMAREGHLVFNHTYSHRSFTGLSTRTSGLSYAQRAWELRQTESVVRTIAGAGIRPDFRPPYGDHNESVLVDVYTLGYTRNMMWSVDSLGWNGLSQAQIRQRVLAGLQPGAIYLFHVGGQSQDGPALSGIISDLRARGYGFTTISAFYAR